MLSVFNQNNTTIFKGIFSLLVLIHHIYQYSNIVNNFYLRAFYQSMGYSSVSIFLLLSGFGLHTLFSRLPNKANVKFIINYISLYFYYLFLVLFYGIEYYILTNKLDTINYIKSLGFGYTVVPLGWYFQVLFVLYLFFWFSTLLFPLSFEHVNTLLVFLFMLFMYYWNLPLYWYECCLSFILGIYLSKYSNAVVNFVKSNNKFNTLICLLMFSFIFLLYLSRYTSIVILSKILSSMIFCFLFISLVFKNENIIKKISKNPFIVFCANNSLGIYTCQGIFLIFYRYYPFNSYLFALICFFGTFLLSSFFQRIYFIIKHFSTLCYDKFLGHDNVRHGVK